MGVQGFPTLKIVKPGSKPGRPIVEDYQGGRTAKAIVDAVVDKIPNHVKRVQDSGLEKWLSENPDKPKAMLFSDKGTVSALLRSLAIDFLDVVDFAQIRDKEAAAVEKYGIMQFPTLVVLPGNGKDHSIYTAEMKKTPILAFMSQVQLSPNPDPAPKQVKSSKTSKNSKSAASSSSFSKVSAAHKPADLYEDLEDAGTVVLGGVPTDSPLPIVDSTPPKVMPEVVPAIPILASAEEISSVLSPKSGTCILVLLPKISGPEQALPQAAVDVLAAFAELAHRNLKQNRNSFPFYGIAPENAAAKTLRNDLGLKEEAQLEVIAVNVKRNWWRVHDGQDVVSFVDSIRLGDKQKNILPEGFFAKTSSGASAQTPQEADESAEAAPPVEHNEL